MKIKERDLPYIQTQDYDVRTRSLFSIACSQNPSLSGRLSSIEANLLSTDLEARKLAITHLARLGGKEAKSIRDFLVPYLSSHPDPAVRLTFLNHIIPLLDEEGKERVMTRMGKKDPDAQIRARARSMRPRQS